MHASSSYAKRVGAPGILRVHTRVPAVDPARITPGLVRTLKASGKTTYVVLHANHARELSVAARAACTRIIDAGITSTARRAPRTSARASRTGGRSCANYADATPACASRPMCGMGRTARGRCRSELNRRQSYSRTPAGNDQGVYRASRYFYRLLARRIDCWADAALPHP